MAPHLDAFGGAYCGDFGRSRGGRGSWPLDSEPVGTLLCYRHRLRHGRLPTKSELKQARTLVVGSLWEERGRRFEAGPGLPLVVEAIILAVEEGGEFLGSAGEARTLLQNHLKKHSEKRRDAESLPRNPEQMGMALSRYGVILREHGVELSRPRRSDVNACGPGGSSNRSLTPLTGLTEAGRTRQRARTASLQGGLTALTPRIIAPLDGWPFIEERPMPQTPPDLHHDFSIRPLDGLDDLLECRKAKAAVLKVLRHPGIPRNSS
ncbi:MAG: hypothetical protein P4L85_23550 [Paludisphaera borealis]|uniref:hypothetical protein n=1 Tax=Paludisphaera borealis TaxID=1387353 RepID=UPI002841E7E3|nr:hypothetical protein [Paludisphaera borealis]MDR3622346.1 hypothetical protein [Paludisphaera borealis]